MQLAEFLNKVSTTNLANGINLKTFIEVIHANMIQKMCIAAQLAGDDELNAMESKRQALLFKILDSTGFKINETISETELLSIINDGDTSKFNILSSDTIAAIKEYRAHNRKLITMSRQGQRVFSVIRQNILDELNKPRRWKAYVKKHWSGDLYIDFTKGTVTDFVCLELLQANYPEAFLDVQELIRTSFQNERIIANMADLIAAPKVTIEEEGLYHALIKLSRFRFEYIVGTKTHVDFNIGQHDLIFTEKIEKINPSYLDKIHKRMTLFAIGDCKNKIKFDEHTFIYKNSKLVALDEIISVYRKAHHPNRGIFINHNTGSGKTLTAIAIAERLRSYRDVILIAPKSLHDNFRKEIKRFGSTNIDRYRYISSNAGNMIDKLETTTDELTGVDIKSLRLDNKLIILDEFHNLSVGMSNGSKNATALYDMLIKARNCRIIMLTASGIINNIYEMVPALNICKGPIRTEDGEMTTLLPESSEDFSRYFIDEKAMKLKNVDKLRNRISGLVSYKGDLFEREVLSFYPMLNTTIKKENYPDRLPIKLVPIHMSSQQYGAYEQAREKERMETRNAIVGSGWTKGSRIILGGELKKSSNFSKSTSYRIKSRQLSNVYEPDGVDISDDIEMYAPKIKSIGDTIKPGLKTLIYSNFVKAGITPMASYLEHIGYKKYQPSNSADTQDGIHGHYGIYSGDVSPEDRTTTLQEYNKENSPLTVLLISSSGAEGLSTNGTRVVHILEPYWNIERPLQVMARGIRYRSHEHLPENERNVQVYIYLAVPPKGVNPTEQTSDVYLWTTAARKYEISQEAIRLMASVSIECPQFNNKNNLDCYKCETREGAPLFLNDLNKDMQYPLPCKRDTKPIQANEIKLIGNMYYLTDDKRVFTKADDEYIEIVDQDVKEWILNRVSE